MPPTPQFNINNAFYDTLGARWYEAEDDPVALLRAENRFRNPWVAIRIREAFPDRSCQVLDLGCGAGFLANSLALEGHAVYGLDASSDALSVARRYDSTASVRYEVADARHLGFANAAFDVVCAMDFLEHVENPAVVVAEAARVLAPGGLFFFHTINRSWLAWLIAIKGIEWFVRNTPKQMHLRRLLIKPHELDAMCQNEKFEIQELHGLRPVVLSGAFFRLLRKGTVGAGFSFRFSRSRALSYCGFARKRGSLSLRPRPGRVRLWGP